MAKTRNKCQECGIELDDSKGKFCSRNCENRNKVLRAWKRVDARANDAREYENPR